MPSRREELKSTGLRPKSLGLGPNPTISSELKTWIHRGRRQCRRFTIVRSSGELLECVPNGPALPRLYQSDGHSRAIRATDDTVSCNKKQLFAKREKPVSYERVGACDAAVSRSATACGNAEPLRLLCRTRRHWPPLLASLVARMPIVLRCT